jgi:hypothetical protein
MKKEIDHDKVLLENLLKTRSVVDENGCWI